MFIQFLYHNSFDINIFDLIKHISEQDKVLEISTTKTWHNGGKKENNPQFGSAKIGTNL